MKKKLMMATAVLFAAGVANAGEYRSPIWGSAFAGHPDLAIDYYGQAERSGEASVSTSLDRILAGNPDGYPHGYSGEVQASRGGGSRVTSLDRLQAGNPDGYPYPGEGAAVGRFECAVDMAALKGNRSDAC
ncbi:MAG: hypothetical protein PVF91_03730 [Chromatiales bacterium]|jgi:hypothetical protein